MDYRDHPQYPMLAGVVGHAKAEAMIREMQIEADKNNQLDTKL